MRTKRRSRDRIGMVAAAALGMAWARGEPKTRAQEVPLPAAAAAGSGVGEAVDRLAEGLKTAPLLRPAGSDRFRLFVVDVETGDAAPIVDEPEKGRSRCGTPSWSPDGRRILFDAAPLDLRQLSRVESLDLAAGAPRIADLGSGRFPCFSPDGNRIAFSLMPRAGGGTRRASGRCGPTAPVGDGWASRGGPVGRPTGDDSWSSIPARRAPPG